MTYKLHPPVLNRSGARRRSALGPFGHTTMRCLQRHLIDHYEAMVDTLIQSLTAQTYDTAVAAARAADIVRSYEEVKLATVERCVDALTELGIRGPDIRT